MFILGRLDNRFPEGFGRFPTDDVVDSVDVAPPFPCRQQARDGVGQAMLVGGYNYAPGAARHALHVAQHERRGNRVGLARTSPSDNDGGVGTDELCQALRDIKVYFFLRSFHPVSLRERVCSLRGRLPRT